MLKERLETKTAARLLWSAALLDAVVAVAMVAVAWPFVEAVNTSLGLPRPSSSPIYFALAAIVLFLVCLALYWFITEVFLRGRTLGRVCLMLEMRRQDDGKRPAMGTVTNRAVRKLSCLGMSGLGLNKAAPYDSKCGLVWHSPMAPVQASSVRNWTISILSGANKGKKHAVGRLPNFSKSRQIKIGRDPAWADIVMDEDPRISSRHATLRFGKQGWQVCDNGSTNKTFVGGQEIQPRQWARVPKGAELSLAGVRILLSPKSAG